MCRRDLGALAARIGAMGEKEARRALSGASEAEADTVWRALFGADDGAVGGYDPHGRLVVIGSLACGRHQALGMLRSMGLDRSRVDLVDPYGSDKVDVRSLEHDWGTALVLVGPVPHNQRRTSNLPSDLESAPEGRYPPARPVRADERLKVTKSGLKGAVEDAVADGLLAL